MSTKQDHRPGNHQGGEPVPFPHSQQSSVSSSKKSSRRSYKGRAMPQRTRTYRSKAARWLEPRLLLLGTVATMLGVLLQIVAVSTDSWLILNSPEGIYRNASGKYLVEAYMGLWRLCRMELERTLDPIGGGVLEEKHESCEKHNLFPTADEIHENDDYDSDHLDYTRTAIAFTIIALVIMGIGHGFAFYALRRPRYIIKRLAALLHFMTAACLLVLNEVFVKTVEHQRENMPGRIPLRAEIHYGYSYVFSWLVFVIFLVVGLIFLFTSTKKKAEYADSNEAVEDEPLEIRR